MLTEFKKVLILAYDFPPYVSVGALRPYSWLKHLKESEIEPVVITRQWSNKYGNGLDYIAPSEEKEVITEVLEYGTVVRAPYFPSRSNRLLLKYGDRKFRLFRKMLTAIDEIRQFIWISASKKQIYLAAENYLRVNKVDVIIATGEPFVLFSFANRLSKKFNIPWIADYRDPWSQNKGRQQNKIIAKWNFLLEKNIVKGSVSVITVSEFIKCKLERIIPNKTIDIIANGFDSEVIENISNFPQRVKELTIAYIGTIYKWHPWKSFLKEFSSFLEDNPNVKIKLRFYGINISKDVAFFVKELPIKTQKSILLFPKTPNEILLKELANCNVMLLFNDYSIRGTKIYDYIGLKRHVVLCYSNDENSLILKDRHFSAEESGTYSKQLQADLLLETNSGVIVENEKHLQQVFHELVNEFNENGNITCKSMRTGMYSRKIQVENLAVILKKYSL